MGWQVTAAVFSTVDDYLQNSIAGYYNNLVENDIGLNTLSDTYTSNADAVTSYADSNKKVSGIAAKAISDGKTTLANMSKSTTKEKLAKIDELVAAAKKDIDEAYATLVKEAKSKAIKDYESLISSSLGDLVTYEYVNEEDASSLLADGKAAIEAATTLQGVFEAYDKTNSSVKGNGENAKNTYTSAYNVLVSRQNDVIDTVLEAASGDDIDDILKVQLSSDDAKKQAAVISALAEFGVEVSELPVSVAQAYMSKALQSRSLELDKDEKVALSVEGEKAVKKASSSVTDALYKAILNKYVTEVNSLESVSTALKTTLTAKLENAASDWKNKTGAYKSNVTKLDIVNGYLGATYKDGVLSYSYECDTKNNQYTLLGVLENVIASDGNKDIANERVSKVLAEYKTKWTAELASVKANDAEYAEAISIAKDTNGEYKAKVAVLGGDEVKAGTVAIKNPALGSQSDEKDGSSVKRESDSSSGIFYSAEAQYESLVDGYSWKTDKWVEGTTGTEGGQWINNPAGFTNVTTAKTWAAKQDGTITKSYTKFMTTVANSFSTNVKKAFNNSQDGTFIKQTTIEKAFESKTEDSKGNIIVKLDALEEFAQTAFTNASKLSTLDTKLSTFVNTVKTAYEEDSYKLGDTAFTTDYVNKGYGKFYKATVDATNESSAFSQILAGKMSQSSLDDFVKDSNLYTIYKTDTLDYTQKTLESFHTAANALVYATGISQVQVEELKTAIGYVDSLFDDEDGVYLLSKFAKKSNGAYVFNELGTKLCSDNGHSKNSGEAFKALVKSLGFEVSANITVHSKASYYASYSITAADAFAKSALAFVKAYAGIDTYSVS